MKRIVLFSGWMLASLLASSTNANPPSGVFTSVEPDASRYPVVLKAVASDGESQCGKQAATLWLLDATGQAVMTPFVVPHFQKLVITDVSWSIAPNPGSVFDASRAAQLSRLARFPGMAAATEHVVMPAERVTTQAATGHHSFVGGPAFVDGTEVCVVASSDGPGGLAMPALLNYARVHGYLQEDGAK